MASMEKTPGQPRIRIFCGDDIAFGPGKAELLTLLAETGSINQAAKRMGMSYMRAWQMICAMNRLYREPLVSTGRGGAGGGGSELTEFGRKVLALYREMEAASRAAVEEPWQRMQRLLTADK